jgi:hypothetical protein
MTQEYLADRISERQYGMHCSTSNLGRIERQEVGMSQPILDALSRILKTSRGNILDQKPPKNDEE